MYSGDGRSSFREVDYRYLLLKQKIKLRRMFMFETKKTVSVIM